MTNERGFYIGANSEGTMFSTVVNYSYDSGGPNDQTLNQTRELLRQPDVLGERAAVVVFAKEGVDGIRIVGPDVASVRIATEKLFEVGNRHGSFSRAISVNRI